MQPRHRQLRLFGRWFRTGGVLRSVHGASVSLSSARHYALQKSDTRLGAARLFWASIVLRQMQHIPIGTKVEASQRKTHQNLQLSVTL